MKRIAVIGAGVSGLSAAAQLAHKGYDVTIFEKNGGPGGRMGMIEGEGFRFDMAPTIVMMPEIYREVFSLCGKNPDDYIPMLQVNPLYDVHYSDGSKTPVSSDLVSLRRELEAMAPQDVLGYLEYIADVYKRYEVARKHFIEKPFRKPSDFYNPATLYHAMQLKTFDSAYKSISKFVKSDRLQKLLSFQTLYIGVSPYQGPSIYTIIPMIELMWGVWFIKGGMFSMAKGMERLCRELGVTIRYSTPVEEITIENGRATGVKAGGTTFSADYVLSTADFPYVMKNLVKDSKARGKYTDKKIDGMDYSCSCLMHYVGLKRSLKGRIQLHNIVFADDFEGNINQIFDGSFPNDPSVYVYAASTLDESLAPDGCDGIYVLTPVPELKTGRIDWNSDAQKEAIRSRVFTQIQRIEALKGFEEDIVFMKELTPLDFQKDFSAQFGATFGLRPTLLQSNYFRPQNKSGTCEGLYFAGASNHPGAGVPIVLTSAKLAVSELIKDDRHEQS